MISRLRTSWLAGVGSVLLLTLAVSGVFGARGGDAEQPNLGQQLSSFVLGLLDVQNEEEQEQDDEELEEEVSDEEDELDEEDETSDEEDENEGNEDENEGNEDENEGNEEDDQPDEQDENDEVDQLDEEDDSTANNHGTCVSAVARSDAVGGTQGNHGGAVSWAARYTCRGLDGPDSGDGTDEDVELDEEAGTEEGDTLGATGPGKSAERGRPDWVSAKQAGRSVESDDAETTNVKSKGGPPEGKGKGSQAKGKGGSAKGGPPGKGRGQGRGR